MSSGHTDDTADGSMEAAAGTAGVDESEVTPEGHRSERPASEVLSDEDNKRLLKYVVAVFGIVGAGFGLTGAFGVRMLMNEGGNEFVGAFFALSVFTIMFFSGPILGAIAGLRIGDRKENVREALITSFAGGTSGYIVMVLVGFLVTVVLFPSGDGGTGSGGGSSTDFFELGDVIVPLIVMAVPVGIVAAGMIYAEEKLLD